MPIGEAHGSKPLTPSKVGKKVVLRTRGRIFTRTKSPLMSMAFELQSGRQDWEAKAGSASFAQRKWPTRCQGALTPPHCCISSGISSLRSRKGGITMVVPVRRCPSPAAAALAVGRSRQCGQEGRSAWPRHKPLEAVEKGQGVKKTEIFV